MKIRPFRWLAKLFKSNIPSKQENTVNAVGKISPTDKATTHIEETKIWDSTTTGNSMKIIREPIIIDKTNSNSEQVYPQMDNPNSMKEATIGIPQNMNNGIETQETIGSTTEIISPAHNINTPDKIIITDNSVIEHATLSNDITKSKADNIITGNPSIIGEAILNSNATNTWQEPDIKSPDSHVEFEFLKNLVEYRLNHPSGQQIPILPDLDKFNSPFQNIIKQHELNKDEVTLLLIGLAPHAVPELFDMAIQEKIKISGDFPEIGGVRGKNFRGFLPTGQTAVYLLAGDNLERRKQVEQLFWSDKILAKKKILWLEELQQSEPVMSGKITMALDYVGLFLFGESAPPHFNTSFPARKIITELTSDQIVMNDEVRRHYENLKDWIDNNTAIKSWDKKDRFKHGFRALFYGPPGTGKTLTANILGKEMGKPVYKIDLSMVVSKYIGETEKNLELLFARAEDKNWILFFDEADAIFGKRTNVRDAHDKYANQEVSYLLQRIEDFDGLVILATNMKNNIDEAFIRRFDDIVKFTLPNENERKEIWEKSFPENSEIEDIPGKVKKYELAGGNIINVIHYATIQAVKKRKILIKTKKSTSGNNSQQAEKKPGDTDKLKFYLEDIIEGIRKEMIKEGKPFGI